MRLEFDVFENNGAPKSACSSECLLGQEHCSHAFRVAPKLDQYFNCWFQPPFFCVFFFDNSFKILWANGVKKESKYRKKKKKKKETEVIEEENT